MKWNYIYLRQFKVKYWVLLLILGVGCQGPTNKILPAASSNNGGLILPGGFSAVTVIDSIGRARHLTVDNNGDIYVKLSYNDAMDGQGGTVGLRDTNNDGRADSVRYFGNYKDQGGLACCITTHDGYLYFSTMKKVYRQRLQPEQLVPESKRETILTDDHEHGVTHWHNTKPMAFDEEGNMYVPFGTPSDACQDIDKYGPTGKPKGRGLDPCPELEKHGGIWRFDANKTGQTQRDGVKYATGIRSVLGMTFSPLDDSLYAVVHGIDNFHTMFPDRYSSWEGAVLPAEKLIKISNGDNFGWPYGYYDQIKKKMILQPGYGGDGKKVGRARTFDEPEMGFPGHWAPHDLLFYRGNQFPERYKKGVFIAFHGSTDRSPYPQAGFIVVFVPFRDGTPTGKWEVFADGFAQVDTVVNTSDAAYRPMGLAEGPDGSLYISESNQGKIWRVMFKGDKHQFGSKELAKMEERKSRSYIHTPDKDEDRLNVASELEGSILYANYCASCHMMDGKGDGSRYPPLAGSRWVNEDDKRLTNIILHGLQDEIKVNGKAYQGVMPPFKSSLDDQAVASIITYIRKRFNDNDDQVTPVKVGKIRNNPNN